MKKSGFTGLEFLIVIAIICMLALIAITSFLKAKNEAEIKRETEGVKSTVDLNTTPNPTTPNIQISLEGNCSDFKVYKVKEKRFDGKSFYIVVPSNSNSIPHLEKVE